MSKTRDGRWGGTARSVHVARCMAFTLCTALALLGFAVEVPRAHAADFGEPGDLSFLSLHGFVSQGFILTARNDYLAERTTRGSFQFSEVGLNVTKPLTDKLRLGLQLFAQDLGPTGNYDVKLDWAYLDYRVRDWLGLRAGRLKIPYGLYNEVNDIDSARLPVLLPQSVYPLQTRQFLFAQTGFEAYGFARTRRGGGFDYRLFAGTIFVDVASMTPASATFKSRLHVPYVVGGRLLWETPLPGLRVGVSGEFVRLDLTAYVGEMTYYVENLSALAVASAEYAHGELLLTAEYSRWYAKQDSNIASSDLSSISERAYAMASYRVLTWLQAGIYYALLLMPPPDVTGTSMGENRRAREHEQHDLAMTLRFDINRYWLVKLEGHYMEGTAGLSSPLQLGPPLAEAARTWGVFLLKTTAYF